MNKILFLDICEFWKIVTVCCLNYVLEVFHFAFSRNVQQISRSCEQFQILWFTSIALWVSTSMLMTFGALLAECMLISVQNQINFVLTLTKSSIPCHAILIMEIRAPNLFKPSFYKSSFTQLNIFITRYLLSKEYLFSAHPWNQLIEDYHLLFSNSPSSWDETFWQNVSKQLVL